MKLIIVRHGDPDYSIDSLTEKGWREAEYLAEKLSKLDVKEFYVSPMGRAKATASCTLKKIGRTAQEKAWLREFSAIVHRPDYEGPVNIAWDWLPQDWTVQEEFLHYDTWMNNEDLSSGNIAEEYKWVTDGLDEILAEHGYVRNGHMYHTEQGNNDTLVFFCHLGVGCVLLSHLLNISPMLLWHGFCAAPSSVTTVVTEERRKGNAYFRMSSYGDTSHLYANDEPASFMARFCECFENDERHD